MFESLAGEVVRILSNLKNNLEKYSYLLYPKKNENTQDSSSYFTINGRNEQALNRHGGNLANLTEEAMRKVRVILINKPSIPISSIDSALVTLKRSLENPNQLAVPADGQYPIFNRADIVVNNEENLEERIELRLHENDTEYQRNRFISPREDRKRMIKYTKEDQKEDYRFRGGVEKQVSIQEKKRSPTPRRRSRDRHETSNRKRRRSRERSYMRSPSSTPKKYSKTTCGDKHCTCNRTPEPKQRDRSPPLKRTTTTERNKTETHRPTRRRSSSREKSTHSRRDYTKERRTRSPYSRIRSCSPQSRRASPLTNPFESGSKSSTNNLPHESHHEEKMNTSPSKYINQYGMPHNFGYHGVQGLWMPQPHFMHRKILPPRMALIGGPRYFVPQPPMFIPRTFYHFRPHVLPNQHRLPVPSESRSTINTPHTSVRKSPNVIEEPSSTSNDSCDV